MTRRLTQLMVVLLFAVLAATAGIVALTVPGGLLFGTELAVLLAVALIGAVLFAWALPV